MNHINIIWFSINARNTLLENLRAKCSSLDITTEVDDRCYWLFTQEPKNGLQVYADELNEVQCDATADRIVELERTRNLEYAILDRTPVSDEFFIEWLKQLRERTNIRVLTLPLYQNELDVLVGEVVLTSLLD